MLLFPLSLFGKLQTCLQINAFKIKGTIYAIQFLGLRHELDLDSIAFSVFCRQNTKVYIFLWSPQDLSVVGPFKRLHVCRLQFRHFINHYSHININTINSKSIWSKLIAETGPLEIVEIDDNWTFIVMLPNPKAFLFDARGYNHYGFLWGKFQKILM